MDTVGDQSTDSAPDSCDSKLKTRLQKSKNHLEQELN